MADNNTSYLPQRRVVVAFENDNKTFRVYDSKDNGGLDVKFSIEYRGFVVLNGAKISICNLKTEEIDRLCTWCSLDRAMNLKKRVVLYVGYGNESMPPLVFSGYIVAAYPSNPPDIWLNMELFQNFDIQISSETMLSIPPQEDITIEDLLNLVCNQVREKGKALVSRVGSLSNKDILKDKLSNFSFEGSLKQFIESPLTNMGKTRNFSPMYLANGIIELYDSDESTKDVKKIKENFVCSTNTGMIGIPHPSYQYLNISMYLNPNIARQQAMRLESKLIPSCNGIWRVWDVVHQGHLRGQEWFTNITARIIGDYGNYSGGRP